jgi:hypothetical protein
VQLLFEIGSIRLVPLLKGQTAGANRGFGSRFGCELFTSPVYLIAMESHLGVTRILANPRNL